MTLTFVKTKPSIAGKKMTDENKDDNKNIGKWTAPTSSYDDAMSIKRALKKMSSQKKIDETQEDDKKS